MCRHIGHISLCLRFTESTRLKDVWILMDFMDCMDSDGHVDVKNPEATSETTVCSYGIFA